MSNDGNVGKNWVWFSEFIIDLIQILLNELYWKNLLKSDQINLIEKQL